MRRASVFALSLAFAALAALPARSADGVEFMQRFSGAWIGTGQLLFGTGSDFACELNGDPRAESATFAMTGRCRMGTLSAPIDAQLRYNAETNSFYGAFMGGAQGDGVDLVGTRAGEGFSMKLVRGPTQGRLAAEAVGANEMKVTIFYRDPATATEFPVVAMGFTRRDVITGSIAK